ncbi:MAG: GNAT family N-acetyltransferase [Acidimicrobiales bacterium]
MSAAPDITFRLAGRPDAAAVARLHADSWRRHYRGAYPDEFLDGPVEDNRLEVWDERLATASSDTAATILALVDAELVGFAHVVLDEDSVHGALVDNLHVAYARKRGGIGGALLAEAAAMTLERQPGSGMFLWVLEQNRAARSFYEARQGAFVGIRTTRSPGGGPLLTALRCVWPDPAVLLEYRIEPTRQI